MTAQEPRDGAAERERIARQLEAAAELLSLAAAAKGRNGVRFAYELRAGDAAAALYRDAAGALRDVAARLDAALRDNARLRAQLAAADSGTGQDAGGHPPAAASNAAAVPWTRLQSASRRRLDDFLRDPPATSA